MALVEQLGDDGWWYVQLAAIWHWYLPLCIYITFFNFILCLSIPFLYFSLTLVTINYTELSAIPACPSLMCSFNRGNIEGTNFENLCLMFVYACFMFAK